MAARSRTFEEVGVWRKAHSLVLATYRFSAAFPSHETFGLRSQLRRAVISVPANFAEGFRKRGHPEKLRFYNIAQASLEESRYYLLLARDLGYGETRSLLDSVDEVARMLYAYMTSIY
jgi:four helix bundle protein